MNTKRLQLGLYTATEVARLCEVDWYTWIKHRDQGLIPPPTTPMAEPELYYTAVDIKQFKKHFEKCPTVALALGLLSIHKMAKRLGMSYSTLMTLIQRGRVPGPSVQHKSRRYYREDQVSEIRAAAKAKVIRVSIWDRVKAMGFLSSADMAKALGMPLITFSVWKKKGMLPKPARKAPGLEQRVYGPEDVETCRRLLASNGYRPKPTASC